MTGTSKVLSALIEEALDDMNGDWWAKPTHDIAGFVAHHIGAAGVTLTQPQPDTGLREALNDAEMIAGAGADDYGAVQWLKGVKWAISRWDAALRSTPAARLDPDQERNEQNLALAASLRSTPAAPHLVIDDTPLYLVCGVCGNADEGGHRGEYLHDFIPAGRRPDECDQPPEGWYCTRTKGHDGPCAALRSTPEHEHAWSTTFGTGPDWWEHCATCGPSVSRHVGPDEEGADRGQD